MKRTVFSFLLLALALSLSSFSSKKSRTSIDAVALISFESQTIDYGTIIQNSDGTKIFKFKNTGDAPLLISNVKTTCGCTVPSYSEEAIMPGESGEIKIKYNTKKLGAFSKSITVYSNTEEGKTILKIKGNVIAAQ